MTTFDALAVGNATLDHFLTIHHAASHIRLEDKELRIKSGEKIPVETSNLLVGGNACNVSVGLSRAGFKSTLMAEVGDDEFSGKILKDLRDERVDLAFIKQTKGPSAFSVILNFKGERTIFAHHIERQHSFNFANLSTNWVYLTSLGKQWKNTYKETVSFIKRSGAKLAFNPGTPQIEEGKDGMSEVLSAAQILFVNKEEAAEISSFKTSDIEQLLREVQKLGPKIVVITDGENGSYLINENGEILKQSAVKTEVVERTGAGDAYASGFLSSILAGNSLETAMRWGAKNASTVISKIGAQEGLLLRQELENS